MGFKRRVKLADLSQRSRPANTTRALLTRRCRTRPNKWPVAQMFYGAIVKGMIRAAGGPPKEPQQVRFGAQLQRRVRDCGEAATDTDSARLQGAELKGRTPQRVMSTERTWANDTMPQPAVRRVDDGMAHRVDRLRAAGNGVVPQQAAEVWRVLRGRLTAS